MGSKMKHNIYLKYTTLFIIFEIIALFPFFFDGRTLVWNIDGIRTHYPIYIFYSDYIKHLIYDGWYSYSFQLYFGGDILNLLHFQVMGDPLNLLTVFFDENNMWICYTGLIVLRQYLCGIAFIIWGKYIKSKCNIWLIISALAYSFSTYIFYVEFRYPYYVTGMLYLPFLFYGVERIFKEKNPKVLIVFSFLSIISNITFAYMNFIAVSFYSIGKVIYCWKFKYDSIRYLSNVAISIILGICTAMVIFLPCAFFMMSSSRADNGYVLPYMYHYPWEYYIKFFSNFFGGKLIDIGQWTVLNNSLIFLPMIILSFYSKNIKYKIVFYIFTLCLFVPYINYMFQGFSYIGSKHIYIYVFTMCSLLWINNEFIQKSLLDNKKKIIKGIVIYFCFCIFSDIYIYDRVVYYHCIVLLWIPIILLFKKSNTKVVLIFILVLTVFNSIRWIYFSQVYNNMASINDLKNLGHVELKMLPKNTTFYRVDLDELSLSYANNALIDNYNGTNGLFAVDDNIVSDFYYYKAMLPINSMVYNGLDGRSCLQAISSVKYYWSKKDSVPYGFQKIKENLYLNEYFLPLSFAYDKYSLYDMTKLPTDIYMNMLNNVLLCQSVPNYQNTPIVNYSKNISFEMKYKNCKIIEDVLYTNKKNSIIELEIKEKNNNGEYYLYIPYIEYVNDRVGNPRSVLTVSTDRTSESVELLTKYHRFYKNIHCQLIKLGNIQNGDKIKLQFKNKGKYKIANPQVIFLSFDGFNDSIQNLRFNSLKDVSIIGDKIIGNITVNNKKLLFFSVPYSKGWKAYVDGVEVPIYKANIMYMAIPLEAGRHNIELRYRTPYLDIGIGVSLVSVLLSIMWIRYLKKKK